MNICLIFLIFLLIISISQNLNHNQHNQQNNENYITYNPTPSNKILFRWPTQSANEIDKDFQKCSCSK